MASILLVEDDLSIREALSKYLSDAGHAVDSVAVGMDGVMAVTNESYDVVVLDLGLPDMDGTQVLKMMRSVSEVPVIVATARDDEEEIVSVLQSGADDYVVKPFSGAQIAARIGAILRRVGQGAEDDSIVVGGIEIDIGSRSVSLDGTPLDLTRKEFDLLAHLASNVGVVVTKRELLAQVWRQPYGGADKTVDVHLSVLRKKLGESAAEPRYLTTVHGVGIKLVDPQ